MGSKKGDHPPFGDGANPGKIFIGGLAKDTSLDTFVKYFERYGEITDSVILKDRQTGRPRGFGFITYADPCVVDKVIEETHVINGKQVEIKKAEPKNQSNQAPGPAFASDTRAHSYGDGFSGFDDSYGSFSSGRFEPAPYRSLGGFGSRFSDYGGYGVGGGGGGAGEYSSSFGGFGGSSYRGEPSFRYSSRFGSYSGVYGEEFGRSGLGAFSRGGGGYGDYGSGSAGYDVSPGSAYDRPGGIYGNRAGYSGSSRYHPYGR